MGIDWTLLLSLIALSAVQYGLGFVAGVKSAQQSVEQTGEQSPEN